jgi:uncharacterized membrane protein YdjX (TVP38/TMEM64 family)
MLNKTYFIHNTTGNIQMFYQCYFNDLLAPVFLLSLIVIMFGMFELEIKQYYLFILIGMIAGLCWEYIIPMIKQSSISDVNDLICYFIGINIFYILKRIDAGKRNL